VQLRDTSFRDRRTYNRRDAGGGGTERAGAGPL